MKILELIVSRSIGIYIDGHESEPGWSYDEDESKVVFQSGGVQVGPYRVYGYSFDILHEDLYEGKEPQYILLRTDNGEYNFKIREIVAPLDVAETEVILHNGTKRIIDECMVYIKAENID